MCRLVLYMQREANVKDKAVLSRKLLQRQSDTYQNERLLILRQEFGRTILATFQERVRK